MSPLSYIDQDRLSQLFHSLLGSGGGAAILDQTNNVVWSENTLVTQIIDNELFLLFSEDERGMFDVDSGSGPAWLVKLPLQLDIDAHAATLLLLVNQDDPAVMNQSEDFILERSLLIANFVTSEFQHFVERDLLSCELSGGNEKMKLLCETDQQIGTAQAWVDSLQKIVESCTSHLNVAFAVIVLESEQSSIAHKNPYKRLDHEAELRKEVRTVLLPQMKQWQKTICVNNTQTGEAVFVLNNPVLLGLKYIACPIFDVLGDVMGMMMLVNPAFGENFKLADKNLAEIVARMATRVIHSHHDALTGLLSRQGFETYLDEAILSAKSGEASHFVLSVGIQKLHIVNESASFEAGDELIKRVAKVVTQTVRKSDRTARLGGDEFLVLLEGCPQARAMDIATRIIDCVRGLDFQWDGVEFETSVSIGLSILDESAESVIAAMSAAEMAQAAAQQSGRNRIKIFTDLKDDLNHRREQLEWVQKIQRALKNDGFELFSQKIESTNKLSGLFHQEILLRMRGEDGEPISPFAFLPIAEAYHLMPAIDRWVLAKTLQMLTDQPENSIYTTDVIWSINLSGQTIADETFLNYVQQQFEQYDIPTSIICFEITETTTFGNLEAARRFVSELKNRGFRFALDDFGTGLSSFAYLQNFELDYLKIDGSFVKNMLDDHVCEAIVSSSTQIGHAMGLQVVAEFVENDSLANRLATMGVDYLQGYGIGKPVPLGRVFNPPPKPVTKIVK